MDYKVTVRGPSSGAGPGGAGAAKPRQSSRSSGRRSNAGPVISGLGVPGASTASQGAGGQPSHEYMTPAFLARMSPNLGPVSSPHDIARSASPSPAASPALLGPGAYPHRSISPQPGSSPAISPIPMRGSHFIPQTTAGLPTRSISPAPRPPVQEPPRSAPVVLGPIAPAPSTKAPPADPQLPTSTSTDTTASSPSAPPPTRSLPEHPQTPSERKKKMPTRPSITSNVASSSSIGSSASAAEDRMTKAFRTPVRKTAHGHVHAGSGGSGKIVSPPPPPPSNMPLPPLPTRSASSSKSSLGGAIVQPDFTAVKTAARRNGEGSSASLRSKAESMRAAKDTSPSPKDASPEVPAKSAPSTEQKQKHERQRKSSSPPPSLDGATRSPVFGLGLGPVGGFGVKRDVAAPSEEARLARQNSPSPSPPAQASKSSPTLSAASVATAKPLPTQPQRSVVQPAHPAESSAQGRAPASAPNRYAGLGLGPQSRPADRTVSDGILLSNGKPRKQSLPAEAMLSSDAGRVRRSEDHSRTSIMWAEPTRPVPAPKEPVVQPRKSSGGLRSLFSRGKAKDKEKDKIPLKAESSPDFPPVPSMPRRRASEDLLRPKLSALFGSPKERSNSPEINATPSPVFEVRRPSGLSSPVPDATAGSLVPRSLPAQQIRSEAAPAVAPVMERSASRSPQPSNAQTANSPDASALSTEDSPPRALVPSQSLHLLELPQFDLSDLSTSFNFDALSRQQGSSKGSASPQKTRDPLRRRSRSFAGASSNSIPSLASEHSVASFGIKLSDSQKAIAIAHQMPEQDEDHERPLGSLPNAPSSIPSMPALSAGHARTASGISGISSSLEDSSPPRTPPNGDHPVNGLAPSVMGSSTDLSESCESHGHERAAAVAVVTSVVSVGKTARPRELQLSDLQTPATITEVDETHMDDHGLAPAADIATPKPPVKPETGPVYKSRVASLISRSRLVDARVNTLGLAENLRRLLNEFRKSSANKQVSDKASLIRGELLDVLLEGEKAGYNPNNKSADASVRAVCVDWVNVLLQELTVEQAANERGACLEAMSALMESNWMSVPALEGSPADQATFRSLMVRIMTYVMSKLSGKGVFHNTLLFAGRMLAFAFFRIDGIAQQLMAALPTKPAALGRFVAQIRSSPTPARTPEGVHFPAHLASLVYDNARAYQARLTKFVPEYKRPDEAEAFTFRPGNWLRRWQSDDSELFGAFYRAYHRQLAPYLASAIISEEARNKPVSIEALLAAPAYAQLATAFATKCHSYITNAVNAVTTVSTAVKFDANESAGARGNVKPPVLETANRRLTETMLSLIHSKSFIPVQDAQQVMECDGAQLWAAILDVWVKNIITRTSLYSPKSVFCLFDLLDGIIEQDLSASTPRSISGRPSYGGHTLMDVPYVISVVRVLLTQTDHHLTLAKTIAFVWTHFDTLCARVEDREELCIKLLLDPEIFNRLLLFWSQSVRSYVLRLVVFRLGHMATSASDLASHEMEVATIQLLHDRLERIRRRHDQLEPHRPVYEADQTFGDTSRLSSASAGAGLTRSKSTITMVETATAPEAQATRAERFLGLAPASPVADADKEVIQPKTIGKATNWLKKSFAKQKKRKGVSEGESESEDSQSSRTSLDSRASLDAGSIRSKQARSPPPPKLGLPIIRHAGVEDRTSPESTGSFEGDASALQAKTVPVATRQGDMLQPPKSPTQFAFEFELKTASPRSDTFDPTPANQPPVSPTLSGTPPRLPPSPHMSRSFSRRSSLLHPVAAGVLDGPASPSYRRSVASKPQPPAYDKRLHPYCIRMLAELEDVQREYEEWWSEGGPGRMDNAPPRLNVAWPFADDED